jgi:hypothetical protein
MKLPGDSVVHPSPLLRIHHANSGEPLEAPRPTSTSSWAAKANPWPRGCGEFLCWWDLCPFLRPDQILDRFSLWKQLATPVSGQLRILDFSCTSGSSLVRHPGLCGKPISGSLRCLTLWVLCQTELFSSRRGGWFRKVLQKTNSKYTTYTHFVVRVQINQHTFGFVFS